AVAEPLRAFALDDLEENRANDRSRKNLQQYLVAGGCAVDENPVAREPGRVFAMAGKPGGQRFVIRLRSVLERNVCRAQCLDGGVNVVGRERDVLNAFAAIVD